MNAVWDTVCEALRQRLDPGQYKVWISPLSARAEGDRLTVLALNDFVAGVVRSRFLPLMQETAAQILGGTPEVLIAANSPEQRPVLAAPARPRAPALAAEPVVPRGGSATAAVALPVAGGQHYLPLSMPVAETSLKARSWRYSFDDFVVGPSNELAFAASRSICGDRGADTLFLSSASGLGKTHLLQAAGRELYRQCNRSLPRVEYLTAEEFVSRLFMAIKTNETDRFKARYRDVDVLLLEDVHFMQGKEKMQEELLATVKALRDRGSKVVFSSSFEPRDLRRMNEALHSRFTSGFLAVIDRPNLDMRKRILREKAKLQQVLLPEDVTDLLAEHLVSDVRLLESCLRNMALKARLLNTAISMQLAWETLGHYTSREKILDLEGIIRYVCQGYGIETEQLRSKSRKREYVTARNTVFYLARKHTDLSLAEIGGRFNRSHSTVIKGITSLEREISLQTPLGRQMAGTIGIIERNGGITGSLS